MNSALVFVNCKMNKRLEEAQEFIQKLVGVFGKRDDVIIIDCI
jgi:triosephosphate isomerase